MSLINGKRSRKPQFTMEQILTGIQQLTADEKDALVKKLKKIDEWKEAMRRIEEQDIQLTKMDEQARQGRQ